MNLSTQQDATTRINGYRNFQATVDRFAEDFAEAVNAFLKNVRNIDKEKLVVFIDDLDRCLPENVIAILEALKLFLDDSPCVFVIGVDRAVIGKAIQAHYRTDLGVSGREYLDKIVQYPFDLPPADQVKLARHFEELLKSKSTLDDKCRYIMNLAAVGNPRIYLRLLSGWELAWSLATQVNESLVQGKNLYLLMIVTVIQIRFPKLYAVCKKNPNGLRVLAELCLQTGTKQVGELEKYFIASDSYEYYESWKSDSVRLFLAGLFPVVAENPSQLFHSTELLKAAFNLSSSIG
jgi:predicted KAP-like P-loop ATPase